MLLQTVTMGDQFKYHLSAEQVSDEMGQIMAAQQDPLKFEPLYRSYYSRILAFVYQRVDSKDTAYDITAQTFYTALDKLKHYQHKGLPFTAWLFRIASNELNTYFRKNKTQRTVNIDQEGIHSLVAELDNVVADERHAVLFNVLQLLEPEEMELINMRFFEQRGFKEICDITAQKESAVKMRVYRILEKLKAKIQRDEQI